MYYDEACEENMNIFPKKFSQDNDAIHHSSYGMDEISPGK